MSEPAVLIMTKPPVPGQAKTRLEPLLGPDGCARLQRELIAAAVDFARAVAPDSTYVAVAGDLAEKPSGVTLFEQRGAGLGERLTAASADAFERHGGTGPLIVIGTDCPQLGPDHARAVLDELALGRDAVIVPARDGGYCLIALARPSPELLRLPPEEWGGPHVLELTLATARANDIDVGVLAPERDLDTPADAHAARADARVPERVRATLLVDPLVSVVVPVLNEASALPALLDRLASLAGRIEVVVVDGGSDDGTAEVAAQHPSAPLVCSTELGRSRQMNHGASESSGEILVFLHADTLLPDDAYDRIVEALREPSVQGGNFALRFDGDDRFSRVLGRWYAAQRRGGIYYGDSAVFVRREVFDHLGGYRPLAIMEDYDFVRRLEKRGRTVCLPGPAVTSARRWRALGVWRTVLSWVVIRWLFLVGVPPKRLARLYRPAR
jgi:rSAM/selenodomain-associated transferase 2/rSAM/selenodomain-associated transferase 1